jgi:hypothetical protein
MAFFVCIMFFFHWHHAFCIWCLASRILLAQCCKTNYIILVQKKRFIPRSISSYLNIEEDDSSSPLSRTNWSELTGSLAGWPETGSEEEAGRVAWASPLSAGTRRYEKLPYGVHYDQDDDECRNVVLGRSLDFLAFVKI